MKVSYNWLKELVDFDLSPSLLAERLTHSGAEVETLEEIRPAFTGVIAGRIKDLRPHPQKPAWKWCRVETGEGEGVTALCGAPNAAVGRIAPLALPGDMLPGGRKVEAAEIGGGVSEGILCSEKELGLGEDHSGIMILPDSARPGERLDTIFDLEDWVLDIDLTPNRPDLMSVVGIAREVAALTGSSLKMPGFDLSEEGDDISTQTSITVSDYSGCPRYCARLIRGIKIKASPFLIRRRLSLCGLRPINNIVDATNYVLLETGHPLHAFDFRKLHGEKIIVRTSVAGEKIVTIDDEERELPEGTLIIADAENPVAVAGVMGGAESEVSERTEDILLEGAYFAPTAIRRSSRALDLSTEASRRFERGADPNAAPRALDRAGALIAELGGGTIAPGVIDKKDQSFPPAKVALSSARTERLLGYSCSPTEIKDSLKSIGLTPQPEKGDRQIFQVPTWRPDLTREIDLVEEVARLRGYDRIPARIPAGKLECPRPEPIQETSKQIREILCGFGLNEVITYSFLDPQSLNKLNAPEFFPVAAAPAIANPVNKSQGRLRTTLIPGILEVIEYNLNHDQRRIEIFEIGTVFSQSSAARPPDEEFRLAVAGYRKDGEGDWNGPWSTFDFYLLKSILEELFERMGAEKPEFSPIEHPLFQPGRGAVISSGDRIIGYGGALAGPVIDEFSLADPLYLAELQLAPLVEQLRRTARFRQLPQYPPVGRDIALIVPEDVPYDQVREAIEKHRPDLLKEFRLFDLYRGEPIPDGKKSFAFRLKYRSSRDTLCEDTVNKIHRAFQKSLISELGCSFRE